MSTLNRWLKRRIRSKLSLRKVDMENRRKRKVKPPGLGDMIESALNVVGITPESIEQWLGTCGGCKKRKKYFNDLSDWANRLISGKLKTDDAEEELKKRIKGDIR